MLFVLILKFDVSILIRFVDNVGNFGGNGGSCGGGGKNDGIEPPPIGKNPGFVVDDGLFKTVGDWEPLIRLILSFRKAINK